MYGNDMLKWFLVVLVAAMAIIAWDKSAHAMDRQTECLAKNIYYEARNLPDVDQIAVAFVTWNRMKSDNWPNTICEVVWQRRQFSWTHDGKSDTPYEDGPWERSQNTAKWFLGLMNDPFVVLEDPTGQATHYHRSDVSPIWAKKLERTVEMGHIFYRGT